MSINTKHPGGILEVSTNREIKVISGSKIIQHLIVSANDKKALQSEVSKFIRGQSYDQSKVTIVQK